VLPSHEGKLRVSGRSWLRLHQLLSVFSSSYHIHLSLLHGISPPQSLAKSYIMSPYRTVTAYAVMLYQKTTGAFRDESTDVHAIFDTEEEARQHMQRCLLDEYGVEDQDFDEADDEVVATGPDGEEYRVWVQVVDRRVRPPVTTAIPKSAPTPKQAYIIVRQDIQED
jgi:hypothetical protein